MKGRLVKRIGLLLIVLLLVVFPQMSGGSGNLSLLEQVFPFAVFAMSYDVLIGFTGIVSFGHAMFFGLGAYAVSVCLNQGNSTTGSLILGFAISLGASLVLSILVAMLSLRIRDTYFAMITLAVGQTLFVLAGSQSLRDVTNAGDGLTILTPDWLTSDASIYYFALAFLVVSAVVLARFVKSPVGQVLKGMRENESRMQAIGFSLFRFKTMAFLVSGVFAALAGGVYAVVQMFVSTDVFSVSTSLNVLLMTIIGGVGTLYGGVLGAFIILFAQTEFGNLAGTYPFLNHYMIIFGLLYIVVVKFMPRGILGYFYTRRGRTTWKKSFATSNKSTM